MKRTKLLKQFRPTTGAECSKKTENCLDAWFDRIWRIRLDELCVLCIEPCISGWIIKFPTLLGYLCFTWTLKDTRDRFGADIQTRKRIMETWSQCCVSMLLYVCPPRTPFWSAVTCLFMLPLLCTCCSTLAMFCFILSTWRFSERACELSSHALTQRVVPEWGPTLACQGKKRLK